MKFYFAPMEGMGRYIYRNAYNKYFHHIDKYFSPFLSTSSSGVLKMKEFKDIIPENNSGIYLVPQLLGNKADDFVMAAREVSNLGYDEININIGCPSGTVTAKNKGAGMLRDLDSLDRCLDGIYNGINQSNPNLKISIKTRTGYFSHDEFSEILEVYEKYPVYELIIHPRTRQDYYRENVNLDSFQYAVSHCEFPLCYNGDIVNVDSYKNICNRFPDINTVMIGRGLLSRPTLVEEILSNTDCHSNQKGISKFTSKEAKEKIIGMHNILYREYTDALDGERNIMFKMKEIWLYLIISFEDSERYAKKIKKSKNLHEFESIISDIERHGIYII